MANARLDHCTKRVVSTRLINVLRPNCCATSMSVPAHRGFSEQDIPPASSLYRPLCPGLPSFSCACPRNSTWPVYAFVYVCIYIYMFICIYIYICILCMYTNIYIYIYIIYTHICRKFSINFLRVMYYLYTYFYMYIYLYLYTTPGA